MKGGREENIMMVLYKCFVLLPPPQKLITRLEIKCRVGNWDHRELDKAFILEE